MTPPKEAEKLLCPAKEDFVAYRLLRDSGEADASMVLFHAQQVIEKCLKAVIVHHGEYAPRTHDL